MRRKNDKDQGVDRSRSISRFGGSTDWSITATRTTVAANNDVMAPHFLVDPLWPKPLLIIGFKVTCGVDVDERDHIFAVHRNTESQFMRIQEIGLYSGVSECCTAPPILEFDLEVTS